jgi:hypothetical protein
MIILVAERNLQSSQVNLYVFGDGGLNIFRQPQLAKYDSRHDRKLLDRGEIDASKNATGGGNDSMELATVRRGRIEEGMVDSSQYPQAFRGPACA